jgi:hypothetical protein
MWIKTKDKLPPMLEMVLVLSSSGLIKYNIDGQDFEQLPIYMSYLMYTYDEREMIWSNPYACDNCAKDEEILLPLHFFDYWHLLPNFMQA